MLNPEVIISILLFILGIVLIVKGGDSFVDAASWIAEVSGIPKFLIGATIVSVATTLPELFVSLIAASKGFVDMAIGNAVGSVTANTGLILAIALIAMNCVAKRSEYIKKVCLLIGASVILIIGSLKFSFSISACVVMLVLFGFFVYENIVSAKESVESSEKLSFTKKVLVVNILKFVLGAAAMVFGSNLLVDKGDFLATKVGISREIISVTLIAIGTSLPELVTTLTAIAKKQSSLSAGNIIGANVIDLTLIMPLSSLVAGKALEVTKQSLYIDMPFCLICGLIAFVPMLIKEKFAKWQGFLLLLVYILYVYFVVTVKF